MDLKKVEAWKLCLLETSHAIKEEAKVLGGQLEYVSKADVMSYRWTAC
jgi:hypothetical protein